MIRQDWMVILAGDQLVDELTVETKAADRSLLDIQQRQHARGIRGAEVVKCLNGYAVRFDSGLQDREILLPATPSLSVAEQWAIDWVAQDPVHRYAWRAMMKSADRRHKANFRKDSAMILDNQLRDEIKRLTDENAALHKVARLVGLVVLETPKRSANSIRSYVRRDLIDSIEKALTGAGYDMNKARLRMKDIKK